MALATRAIVLHLAYAPTLRFGQPLWITKDGIRERHGFGRSVRYRGVHASAKAVTV
jgi:hypothetical protein